MPVQTFVINKPIDTTTATVDAQITGMTPGTDYTFQLVVFDDVGNESQPVTAVVNVRELPVAKIAAPKVAPSGKPITLDAAGSTPAGQIKSYRWTLVSATPAKK